MRDGLDALAAGGGRHGGHGAVYRSAQRLKALACQGLVRVQGVRVNGGTQVALLVIGAQLRRIAINEFHLIQPPANNQPAEE